MKIALVAGLLALSCVGAVGADESNQAFASWYDGWGTHTIWGIGKVASGYASATVKCGIRVIPVRAVYDTHADIAKPTATQTREYAKKVNLALLRELEEAGDKCEFQLAPPS